MEEVVIPVKDHRSCGSWRSFSATGPPEGAFAVGKVWTQTMSEHQILDCDNACGACNGGEPSSELGAECVRKIWFGLRRRLLQLLRCGPWFYGFSGCSVVLTLGSIWGAYSVDLDEGSHCAAVIQQLPIVQFQDLQRLWDFEWSRNPYWKVKNSWATTWSISGHMLISRPSGSGDATCGIQLDTNGVYVHGPNNPSSQIRGADGEFIEELVRKTLVWRLLPSGGCTSEQIEKWCETPACERRTSAKH